MNFPERMTLINGDAQTPAFGMAVLVSAKEAEGVFNVTDVSIRVPASYPVLPVTGKITVASGPMAGTYSVTQVRPNRHHSRYICSRLSGYTSA